ncbi:MAG: Holliday junction resolvase RuvX [Phycisphaerae bacterium]
MNAAGRVCGVDHGTKRIGLAVTDPERGIASPLVTLNVGSDIGKQVQAVLAAVTEYDIAEWVVGLPLNMDGSEGAQAAVTRRFGECLARAVDAPVRYFDERLSSIVADQALIEADLTRKQKKARRDKVAAQIILQSYVDQPRARTQAPADDPAEDPSP